MHNRGEIWLNPYWWVNLVREELKKCSANKFEPPRGHLATLAISAHIPESGRLHRRAGSSGCALASAPGPGSPGLPKSSMLEYICFALNKDWQTYSQGLSQGHQNCLKIRYSYNKISTKGRTEKCH